jgi:hypothetical protein
MGNKPNDWLIHPIADWFAIRTRSQPGSNSTISVVHPAELSTETQQTSGSLRMSAITQCMVLPPPCGQAYLWLSLQRRLASLTTANRTPSFTFLKEKLVCGGATPGNTRLSPGRAIFCMCRVGCHIRSSTRRKRILSDGWLCEVRQSRSLSICLTISGHQLTRN